MVVRTFGDYSEKILKYPLGGTLKILKYPLGSTLNFMQATTAAFSFIACYFFSRSFFSSFMTGTIVFLILKNKCLTFENNQLLKKINVEKLKHQALRV